MKAEIITIGDEILIGQIVDTNSAWIGQQLNLEGIRVVQITSVSDEKQHILKSLSDAESRADIIFITGGLGPTKDDITKHTLAEYFSARLIVNEEVLGMVREMFVRRDRPFLEVNRRQAEVPENCTVIVNQNGTAPGMWFEREDKYFMSMPGVPHEMKAMMSGQVLPMIRKKFKLPSIYHKTVLTQGLGESFLAQLIERWEDDLALKNIKLAYLPALNIVRLRLSASGTDPVETKKKVEDEILKLRDLIPEYIYGYEEFGKEAPKLEQEVGKLLLKNKKTLALAESCTGGYISHLLTSVAGSSAYYNGSIVPYHNRFKHELVEVDNEIFESVGSVSEECVIQMAKGVQKRFGSDYAIAVSGIAGPGGATDEKPVGTVWIAVCSKEEMVTEKFVFFTDRMRNIQMSANTALNMLRKLLEINESSS
ncbi:MAG: competence/damage-inducible protein A [Bacteroidia bacterium]